jgi:flagellar FliJ protein
VAKFNFKLQSVLTYREKKEDALKKELADLKAKHERERQILHGLARKLDRKQKELKQKQLEKLDVGEISLYHAYISKVQENIVLQTIRVQELLARVCAKREKLIEASKEKRMMEKLYDKHFEEWQQSLLRDEQKLIDELATSRNRRRRASSLLGGYEDAG